MQTATIDGYSYLRRKLKERANIDLSLYKDTQMVRRLNSYIERVGVKDFLTLAKQIERDDGALQHLKDFITINVSEFFRNPERFEHLAWRVLPELKRRFGDLNVWSAGCSIGAEPYSLAILLEEMDPVGRHKVLATDIDSTILRQASLGVFAPDKLKEVTMKRKQAFFQSVDDRCWEVRPVVKRRVEFRLHDLLQDPYPENFHLILCRNVVIYFTDAAKEKIYQGFANTLVPGGYLLVGSTESILNPRKYGFQPAGPFLYQRLEGGA